VEGRSSLSLRLIIVFYILITHMSVSSSSGEKNFLNAKKFGVSKYQSDKYGVGALSGSDDSGAGEESFAEAFEKQLKDQLETLKPGRIVSGKVAAVSREVVTLDIGFKSDGVVPTEQFIDSEGKINVKIGDIIDVMIMSLEGDSGQLVLSKERAEQKKIWNLVEKCFKDGSTLSGKITQKVKGGLQVDIGIPAFLPGSQIDVRPHRNLDKFLGESYDFKVLKITRDKGNIVLSRRAVLLSERDNLRSETLKVLSEGVVMEGIIKNVTEYGAFVDLGGIDGLLHITDISWGKINHPSEKISVGQSVPVVVLKYDQDKERVSLGMKQLQPDPWGTVHERYPTGGRVSGKVTSITEYGAFVELEDGVEGLVHVSEMTWKKNFRNPSKLVNIGDKVEAVILGLDSEQRRISLGIKQLMPNPWEQLVVTHPKGTRVKGKVRSITDFGIFIGIEDGIDGLVHITDFSWIKRIRDPQEISQLYKKGDEVEAVVLDVDVEAERLSLGIKQLASDPWESIPHRYPVGARVHGKVKSVADFGVFVELEDGIEGLVHNTQLGIERDKNPAEVFEVGKEVEAEVTSTDPNERRISLSIRTLRKKDERDEMAGYMTEDVGGTVTFGDILQGKFGDNKRKE
jgi:small subunit ribosomal protein S1